MESTFADGEIHSVSRIGYEGIGRSGRAAASGEKEREINESLIYYTCTYVRTCRWFNVFICLMKGHLGWSTGISNPVMTSSAGPVPRVGQTTQVPCAHPQPTLPNW